MFWSRQLHVLRAILRYAEAMFSVSHSRVAQEGLAGPGPKLGTANGTVSYREPVCH